MNKSTKIKLPLQIKNTCNSQIINQRNIRMARPHRLDTKKLTKKLITDIYQEKHVTSQHLTVGKTR